MHVPCVCQAHLRKTVLYGALLTAFEISWISDCLIIGQSVIYTRQLVTLSSITIQWWTLVLSSWRNKVLKKLLAAYSRTPLSDLIKILSVWTRQWRGMLLSTYATILDWIEHFESERLWTWSWTNNFQMSVAPEAIGRLGRPPYLEKVRYGIAIPKMGV